MARVSMSRALSSALMSLLVLILAGCGRKEPGKESAQSLSGSASSRATPQKVVELSFVYGSEKQAWLSRAIDAFNGSDASRIEGGRIKVVGTAAGSGSAVQDIVDGASKPDAFAPATSYYLDDLNRKWLAKTGAVGRAKPIAPEGKSLVLSPMVIAMWKPMAQALGWPEKPLGWGDILTLAKNPQGWASLGHPEWGAFKLGHTHPEFSNSGQASVLAEIYAATNLQRDLDVKLLGEPKVAAYLGEIERSIVHYGKSTGFFATKMLERGPSFLSAAVLYENLVVDSYRQEAFKDRAFDVVCIYPKEGTFWSDNPYSVLDASWVDTEKRGAAQRFGDYLRSKEEQQVAMANYGFRPSDPTVGITAPLDAAHGVDPKQPVTLLEVPPLDTVDAALELWRRNKKPVDIMFVFDRSGSMNGEPLNQARQGALDFLDQLDDRDRVALLMFNDQIPKDLGVPMELGKSRSQLKDRVSAVFANGGTALFDAVKSAHQILSGIAAKEPHRIFAIVLLTDGRDEHSKSTLAELRAELGVSEEMTHPPVRVFTIAYGSGADPAVLAQIAETGGGASYKGNTSSIRQVYRELAAFF